MLLRASQQGGSEPSRVAAWIRSALGHPAWEVRNMAVKLIPRSGDPALFPLLIGRAGDRHEAGIVRRNAIAMLREANFWTPAARAVIMACFTDRYWEVRSEALATFAFLEAPSRDAEAAVLGVLRQVNRSAPHWQGSHESMIRERNFEVRAACAQALGALTTTPLGVSALTLLTHDRSWIVAYQAAVALAEVALRQANLRGQAHEGLSCVHISAEGAVPHHPYRERLQALRRLQAAGQNSPEIARSFYLDLKRGWNILSQ